MKHSPRVVFDTNIYISAILFGGNPRQCLELAKSREITLFTSNAILVELAKKLREKFFWREEDIHEVIEGILLVAKLIKPSKRLSLIKDDPQDNRILECAQAAKADFIVSGDKKHVLSLQFYKDIPIVSAREFLERFYEKK